MNNQPAKPVAFVSARVEPSSTRKAIIACLVASAALMSVEIVSATTSLTVNCSSTLRGVTRCGSGSLYGITETKPSDISSLVVPLRPYVFVNPPRAGSQYQQPVGAGITVAK